MELIGHLDNEVALYLDKRTGVIATLLSHEIMGW